MTSRFNVASVVFGISTLTATLLGPVGLSPVFAGALAMTFLFLLVYGGRKWIPGFYRTLGASALAGAIAGGLILGPGFRIAMRVVSLLDPARPVEFTVGGTFFIIAFVGVFGGVIIAVAAIFVGRGLDLGPGAASLLASVFVLSFLVSNSELRMELMKFGAGGWINVPMFGLVGYLYGMGTHAVLRRIHFMRPAAAERVEVMA